MEENKKEKQELKMPRDLRVGISMMLTLLDSHAEDDIMTRIIISVLEEEAVAYEEHQDLTKLIGIKSIMMSMYDAFADALALLKDTPCINGVAEFRTAIEGEENDN